MTEQKTEGLDLEFDALCCEAAEHSTVALQKLSSCLREMASFAGGIAVEVREQRLDSLELVVSSMTSNPFSLEQAEFLESSLAAGFDSPAFRDRYALLCKQIFNRYSNPAGLLQAIGFRDENITLPLVAKRLQMMRELKIGAFCHDPAFGTGTVASLDDLSNEVTVSLDRKRTLRLRSFFDSMLLVKMESALHTLLMQKKPPVNADGKKYLESLRDSLLCVGAATEETVREILVPVYLTEERYNMLASGNENNHVEGLCAVSEHSSSADSRSWDNSRSIDELVERLKTTTKLKVEQANLENVRHIFSSVAHRSEQSEAFAMAAAMIQKEGVYDDFLQETMKGLADKTEVWSDVKLFVEICDKLPGKLVPFWLKTSQLAKGNRYLAEATLQMPYRLWGHVEKLLALEADDAGLLSEHIYQAFQEGKVTPEHFFWLWKAPKCELRSQHLANSYLLFKILHAEARGSYLKSKRALHKLLVDDEQFQREVMKMGDQDAIKALVRCVKHQPLLDKSERQSLLVKIVRHYPEAIHEVEERGRNTHRTIANVTSIRSYQQCKKDLEELINVLVPENISAIEHARSLGDLRENSEFKYAKERQAFLNKRRAELENRLNQTKAIDFSEIEVDDTVVPGCSVIIEYADGKQTHFHVLGRFDSKPEENKIAYDSPLGKVLVGSTVNDELKLPSGEKAILTEIKALPNEMIEWLNRTME
jgi:transcription elongation GreA/GreB family factor